MANSEDIKLIIEAQDKASKQLDTITKSLGGFVDKAESSADTLANLGKAAAGYFAFDKVKDFLVSSVSEFAKAEQSAKLMEAVLKQTGNTTGMTAAQILAYADSIEQATGIEAESLQAAATQLARNAKLTGDQFKDLLRLGTDMSVVLGGDIASNSLILAKALESPENAVAKLAKVFIFFTEEQKKQIATMLEAGDVAKAYSVIIGEIDRQVGGVAEKMGNTTAGRLKKLENAYGNFKEGIGGMSAGGIVNTTDKLNSVGNYLNGSDPSKLLEDASKFQIAIETKMRSVTDIQEDARKQIEASNKKELELLAAATQIQSEIDGSNLWTGGNGSIFGIKVGEDVDELTVKLKKLHDEVSRIRGERWAFEGSGLVNLPDNSVFDLIQASAGGAASSGRKAMFDDAAQGGVASMFAQSTAQSAQAGLDKMQADLAASILRSNMTQQQKLQEELAKLFSVETLLPADEFTRIRERIEAELKMLASQTKNAGIQALLGGAEGILDIADKQAAENKRRDSQVTPGLAALESRFLTRGPTTDPRLAAQLANNEIAKKQLRQQERIEAALKDGPFVVRGI